MANKMTAEQQDLVLFVIRSGIACGLTDVEDCILNWQHHVVNLYLYSEIPNKEREMYAALCAFYQDSAGCAEEQDELNALTPETTPAFIGKRIAASRAERERRDAIDYRIAQLKAMDPCDTCEYKDLRHDADVICCGCIFGKEVKNQYKEAV